MKLISVLLLTASILATTVPLHAEVEPPQPAATAAPVVYEPLPTLNAGVILQPQYLQGPNFTVRNPVPGEKAAGPAEDTGCSIKWPA